MKTYKQSRIGDLVTQDFRAAEVFKKAGIDFCCGGSQSLEDACRDKKLVVAEIESELSKLENSEPGSSYKFNEWKLDFLCDYIVNTHHQTVMNLLPELTFYTQKIAEVHGDNHPELPEIANLFAQVDTELRQHLCNEEEVLFPAIREVLKTNSAESKATIISEITRMTGEHEFAGGAMDKINELSRRYAVPEDGCNTYRVAYKLLEQFEDDLHIHVHLENNILYPKAMKLSV